MTHAMVTFVAPLALDKVGAAENAIDVLGNPASNAVQTALALRPNDENETHFASLHAIRSQDGENAYIVFEFSADGPDDVATSRIVSALGSMLKPVFMLSSDWSDGGDLAAFLKDHEVAINNGLSGNAGLPFAGTPGFTVGRIQFESRLARQCALLVEKQDNDRPALHRIAEVRQAIAGDAEFSSALQPATPAPPFEGADLIGLVGTGVGQFVSMYLWPLGLLVLIAAVINGLVAAWSADGFWHVLGAFALGFWYALWA